MSHSTAPVFEWPGWRPPLELRPPSFATAYRLLGSISEAEDFVQEAPLRLDLALDKE
jgi:hypothetical protein